MIVQMQKDERHIYKTLLYFTKGDNRRISEGKALWFGLNEMEYILT